jgi:hypothetical protein
MNKSVRNAFGFGLLLTLGAPGFARTPSVGKAEPSLKITIRVFNYARVPKGTLKRAEKQATTIFREAGVETVWLDCTVSPPEAPNHSSCLQRHRPTELALSFLSQSLAERAGIPRTIFGFAKPTAKGEISSEASILFYRVEELAARKGHSETIVLGHVMAHEIGHLLLRPQSHSRQGLMHGRWSGSQLRLATSGRLLFSPREAERVRADVLARMSSKQTPQTATLASLR